MRIPPFARLGVVAALVLLLAAPAAAKVYRWVDDGGTPHFSDRAEDVPPRYRYQLEESFEGGPDAGASRFVVVPGLNRELPEDGQPVQQMDGAAFEAEAMAALADLEGGGPGLPDFREVLSAGGPTVAGFVLVLLVALAVFVAIAVFILRLACRICGEEPPAFGKGAGIVVAQSLASFAVGLLIGIFLGGSGSLQVQSASFGVGLLVQAGVLRGLLIESFGKSLAVTAVVLLIQLALGVVVGGAVFLFALSG